MNPLRDPLPQPQAEIAAHRIVSVRNRLGRIVGEFVWASGPDGEGVYEFHDRDGGVRLSGFSSFSGEVRAGRKTKAQEMDEQIARFMAISAPKAKASESAESAAFNALVGENVAPVIPQQATRAPSQPDPDI